MLARILAAAALIAFATGLQLVLSDVDQSWDSAELWGAGIGCVGCVILIRRATALAWTLSIGGGLLAVISAELSDEVATGGFLGYSFELAAFLATALVLIAAAVAWWARGSGEGVPTSG